MAADFRGRVALVTGVGRAGQLGAAVARGFAEAGAEVVIAGREEVGLAARLKEFKAAGFEVRSVVADLAQPEGARAAVAAAQTHFGGLDVVVNVAGGLFSYGPVAETTPDALDLELTANLKTAFFVSQAAAPVLLARGTARGAIVNFASIGALRPLMHMAAYSAAKSAVAGLTRALAREYRDAGIRVNAVAPATVRTADNVAQLSSDAKTPMVELAEVVQVVLFLASDEASAISGQIVPVTGKAG